MFKIITIPFDCVKKGFDEELLNRVTLNKQIKSQCAVSPVETGVQNYLKTGFPLSRE
jgi:hypothetical protein